MKVVHINEHLAPKGGVETYLFSLLPLLQERGMEAHFLYGSGDPAHWPRAAAVPEIGRADIRLDREAEQQVYAVLEQERPDVVHVHNVQNVGAIRASLRYGRALLTTHDYRSVCPANSFFYKRTQEVCGRPGAGLPCFAHAVYHRCLTPRPRYATYFYRRSRETRSRANEFAAIIAPSRGAQQFLLQAGIEEEATTVLPYFCPLAPLEHPRPTPERPTITFLGRVAANKGHEYFIEALGRLPEQFQGVMVGNLDEQGEAAVRALAGQHGCGDRLRVRKWASRSEVIEILDQTTVLIFPSLWPETLGIVGVEAMSRGVPVVASNLGGVTEWLTDGVTGRLVAPKSAAQISEAVLDIAQDDDRLQEMGRNAIDVVRSRFLPGQHVERLVALYRQAARQR